jgi:hypothetical protein
MERWCSMIPTYYLLESFGFFGRQAILFYFFSRSFILEVTCIGSRVWDFMVHVLLCAIYLHVTNIMIMKTSLWSIALGIILLNAQFWWSYGSFRTVLKGCIFGCCLIVASYTSASGLTCSLSGIGVLAPQVNARRFKSIYNLPPTFFLANNSVRFILWATFLYACQHNLELTCIVFQWVWCENPILYLLINSTALLSSI